MAVTKRKLVKVLDKLMGSVSGKSSIMAAGIAIRKLGEALRFAVGREAGVLNGN